MSYQYGVMEETQESRVPPKHSVLDPSFPSAGGLLLNSGAIASWMEGCPETMEMLSAEKIVKQRKICVDLLQNIKTYVFVNFARVRCDLTPE